MSAKVDKVGAGAPKRRVMTSYEKLSDELIELLKKQYPDGFTDHMTRVEKPNGELCYGVMLETEDTAYFVKISVKIDDKAKEDIEKELFADSAEIDGEMAKGGDEIPDIADSDEN